MPTVHDDSAPARNLEIKVACGDDGLAEIRERLDALDASVPERLAQVDTYFRATTGRLKLRTITPLSSDGTRNPGIRAELIGYTRADSEGSRWSTYHLVPVAADAVDSLRSTLDATIGTLVTVAKRRDVVLLDHTRIHLDEVEGLGGFVELETVVSAQSDDAADQEHHRIITALGLNRWSTVAGSYSDLLLAQGASAGQR